MDSLKTLYGRVLSGLAQGWERRWILDENLLHISRNCESWHCYTSPKVDLKICKACDTVLELFSHQYFYAIN